MDVYFKELFDYLSSGLAVYEARENGRDFVFMDLNPAGERIDRIRKEEVLGQSVLKVFPGIVEFGFFEVLQRVWRTGHPEHHPIARYEDKRLSGWRENYVFKLPSGLLVARYDDCTERKQVEELIKESEERYRAVVEFSNDGIALVGGDRHLYVNPKMVEIFGYDRPEELIGKPVSMVIHPDDRQRVIELNRRRQQGEASLERYECKGRRKNGEAVHIEISARKVIYQGESCSLAFLRDITLRKEMEEQLDQSVKEWQQTFDSMNDGVSLHDLNGTIIKTNKALGRLLAADPQDLLGGKCYQIFHNRPDFIEGCPMQASSHSKTPHSVDLFEPWRKVWLSVSCSPLFKENNEIKGVVHVVRDISRQKQAEEKLQALSLVDELTGLYNRRGFLTLAEQELKTAYRLRQRMLLLYADLDRLKWINDTLGHQQGDLALKDTAAILKSTFRDSDILARIGGDEFVALAMETGETAREAVLKRVQEGTAFYNRKGIRHYTVSLSCGISVYDPEQPVSLEDLLLESDASMYHKKRGLGSRTGIPGSVSIDGQGTENPRRQDKQVSAAA